MQMYEGVEVSLHTFLTLVLAGGKWLASYPSRFTPEERTVIPRARKLGGPQSCSGDCCETENNL
jgi:hypothetical protein